MEIKFVHFLGETEGVWSLFCRLGQCYLISLPSVSSFSSLPASSVAVSAEAFLCSLAFSFTQKQIFRALGLELL